MKTWIVILACLFLAFGSMAGAEDESADVVVVGGGAAGLTAAIEASSQGLDVILLEKMPFVGGSTVISGGATIAAGSSIQEAADADVTSDDLYEFLMEEADGQANSDFLRSIVDISGPTIDWLVDLGVPYVEDQVSQGSPYSEYPFVHSVDGGGSQLTESLRSIASDKGVDIRVESPGVGLVSDDTGAVVGVKVEDPDETYELTADKVILATGSIAGSDELMEELALPFLNNLNLTGQGNTGDGMVWARELGADVIGRGVMGIRGVDEHHGYYGDVGGLVYDSTLYVNLAGERFADETKFYPELHVDINNQPGKITYAIFDQNNYHEAVDQAIEEGLAYKGDTLEELAMKASIVPDTFVETVEEYNQFYEAGEDEAFGVAADRMTPAVDPPFYAVVVRPAIIGTFPGLLVDDGGRVLTENGEAIPNLFAAGDLILGNVFWDTYPTSGGGIGMAVSSGRLAGETASEQLTQ